MQPSLPHYVTGRSHDVTKFESSRDVAFVRSGFQFLFIFYFLIVCFCFVLFFGFFLFLLLFYVAFDNLFKLNVLYRHMSENDNIIKQKTLRQILESDCEQISLPW